MTDDDLRVITGCDAVHPDRRGGQHVAMACPGVLVIDDDAGIGVLCMHERSQFKCKKQAIEWLNVLKESETAVDQIASWLESVSEGVPTDSLANIAANIRKGAWRK